MDSRSASQKYDVDEMVPSMKDEKRYCNTHDVFKVKNTVGDFVCVACRVVAGQRHKNREES